MPKEFRPHKFEIDIDEAGHGTITLDGQPLDYCYGFEIKGSVDDAVRVKLDLVAVSVEGTFDHPIVNVDGYTHSCTQCSWTGNAPPVISQHGEHLNSAGGVCKGAIHVESPVDQHPPDRSSL